jgi:ribosomal-protein-alanine N-acetyltransferase
MITEVLLEVRASNSAALAFYRALGFAIAGRRPLYYADPIEDAVLMELRLA